jgi:hypothetical protein
MFRGRATSLLSIVLMTAVFAACSSGQGNADQSHQVAYRAAVCGAMLGLADNQRDFSVFLKGDSRDEAVAALHRVQDRTSAAADRLEAAATEWSTGSEAAQTLAATQRSLLPILADLDTVATSGDLAKWTTATHDYTVWYNSTQSVLQTVAPTLTSLGVNCI